MATNPTLLRAVTVISILIIHPLLITSHTLLRKRGDDINNNQKFAFEEHHDYISTKILTKLIPSNTNTTNVTTSSASSSASPMACIHQENKLKKCYEKLPQSFNEIKCTQCIYGNVNPSTQVITCPHSDYCSSVSGCTEGVCPKECEEEFYEVLDCIWEKAGCGSTAGVGDGECGVAKNKKKKGKKKVVSDPYPSRDGTAATVAATTTTTKVAAAASSKNGSNNPCSECSTSKGGTQHNFCGNLNVHPIQDVCSSQTECSDHGLKCKVCTKIVNNDGYGGKSVVEDVGSGAYVCVKEEVEDGGDKKAAPAAAGKGGNDTSSAATSAASSSTSSSNKKKQQKGADAAAVTTTTSSTGKKKQKGVTTTTTTSSSTTPAGGFCHSRAVVLGNCIFTKDTSPDCLNCIHSGTQEHSPDTDPTCQQVQQHQFCTNIASCAKEHCGKCTFEFYTGLNCVLQKIPGCEQFSCAIGGGGIEGAISSSSGGVGGGGYDASSDGYGLQKFRDDVERQYKMMNPRMEVEDEVFVREA